MVHVHYCRFRPNWVAMSHMIQKVSLCLEAGGWLGFLTMLIFVSSWVVFLALTHTFRGVWDERIRLSLSWERPALEQVFCGRSFGKIPLNKLVREKTLIVGSSMIKRSITLTLRRRFKFLWRVKLQHFIRLTSIYRLDRCHHTTLTFRKRSRLTSAYSLFAKFFHRFKNEYRWPSACQKYPSWLPWEQSNTDAIPALQDWGSLDTLDERETWFFPSTCTSCIYLTVCIW